MYLYCIATVERILPPLMHFSTSTFLLAVLQIASSGFYCPDIMAGSTFHTVLATSISMEPGYGFIKGNNNPKSVSILTFYHGK